MTGAATVVQAIDAGKKAAWAMDAFLRGEDMAAYEAGLPEFEKPPMIAIPAWRPEKVERQRTGNVAAGERRDNFREVEQGFSEQAAQDEGERCLQCICEGVETCKLRRYSINHGLHQGGRQPLRRRPAYLRARHHASVHPARPQPLHRLRPLRPGLQVL